MSRRFPLTSTLCLAAVAVGAVLGFANQAPRAHAESLPSAADATTRSAQSPSGRSLQSDRRLSAVAVPDDL